VVFILFTWFIIRYRYTKERQNVIPKDVKGNLKLELTYTILPILLLIVLAVPTIKITMHQSPSTEAAQEKGTQIDVTAKQLEWKSGHGNDNDVTDELIVAEQAPIVLHLQPADVIHSFWVPELAGKVDVFPNKELTYVIEKPEKGTDKGICAEFCGVQHTDMTFTVKVVSEEDYDEYLHSEKHE